MMTRVPLLVVLAFAGWSNVATAERAGVDNVDQLAAKEMDVGRWYMDRRDYTAAVNRFKTVVIHYSASQHVEEALAHLVEAYLALGIPCEAQNTRAALSRKFPDGRWTATARVSRSATNILHRPAVEVSNEAREDLESLVTKLCSQVEQLTALVAGQQLEQKSPNQDAG